MFFSFLKIYINPSFCHLSCLISPSWPHWWKTLNSWSLFDCQTNKVLFDWLITQYECCFIVNHGQFWQRSHNIFKHNPVSLRRNRRPRYVPYSFSQTNLSQHQRKTERRRSHCFKVMLRAKSERLVALLTVYYSVPTHDQQRCSSSLTEWKPHSKHIDSQQWMEEVMSNPPLPHSVLYTTPLTTQLHTRVCMWCRLTGHVTNLGCRTWAKIKAVMSSDIQCCHGN